MSVKKITTYLGTAAVALALGAIVTAYPGSARAGDDETVLRCDDEDGLSAQNSVWKEKDGRMRFSAEGEGFTEGESVMLTIAFGDPFHTVSIQTKDADVNGFVDFDYDSQNNNAPDDVDNEFPSAWPTMADQIVAPVAGHIVEVGMVGCSLQNKEDE